MADFNPTRSNDWMGFGRESAPGPTTPAHLYSVLTVTLWHGRTYVGHEFYGLERRGGS